MARYYLGLRCGWVLANTLYKPKGVITVEFSKDTTDALGAVLHAADETYQGTSELAVRGLGGSELVQLDKRGLNPFATFTAGNAGSKVMKPNSCLSIHIRTLRTPGWPHRRGCHSIQHWSQCL
jgi:hypothetical protein